MALGGMVTAESEALLGQGDHRGLGFMARPPVVLSEGQARKIESKTSAKHRSFLAANSTSGMLREQTWICTKT